MFKTIKMRLTWTNAVSYFVFLVIFLTVFYIAFAQILTQVQQNMLENYYANNTPRFFTIYNVPPPPPNRFDVEVNRINFFYVISNDLEILYGEELNEGFYEHLEPTLHKVDSKHFELYEYEGESLLVMLKPMKIREEQLGYIAVGQNVTYFKTLLQNVLLLLIGLLIISSLGIALLSYYLAKKSMAPIQVSYEQQRQFVANASHELRTPLSVLYSSLELFETQLKQEGTSYPADTMDDMKHEANYMNDMLSSLLYLTRSDQNQLQLNKERVDISALLIQRTRRFARTAPHLSFELDVAEDVAANVDKLLLEELLYILLKNAVTYTKEGKVIVRAHTQGPLLQLEVEDTGMGISADDLPHIFERFYRADKVRGKSGTGLGLSIAKVIVALHDGRIDVQSELNKGTIFLIELAVE